MERLESQWMVEQDPVIREQRLLHQPCQKKQQRKLKDEKPSNAARNQKEAEQR